MKSKNDWKLKENSNQRVNKKGDVSLYFVLIGVLIFAITLLIYMGKMEGTMQKVGENTVKVVNTFEMSERLLFYVDASAEIAAKEAKKEVIKDSGYLQEKFKGKIQNSGCGTLAYPIIDSDRVINSPKKINECFPSYEDEFKIIFTRNLNKMLINYDPFKLNPTDFDVTVKRESTGLKLKVISLADMNLPVYAYIESYYRNADKTKTSKETPNTITKTTEGYFTMREYLVLNSFNRQGTTPTRIVIHDTKTATIQETFVELQTGLKNYNYVIDTNGEIYQFAPETKYTRNSGCVKGGTGTQNTCIIEDTDKDSISIALVNKPLSTIHSQSQTNSLIKLIAEISTRNPTILINDGTILLNSDIDSSRKNDPAQDIVSAKADIINRATQEKNKQVTQPTVSVAAGIQTNIASVPGKYGLTNGNGITGNAVTPPNVNEANCFSNILTTVYYTPDMADHSALWASQALPCPNSYGYCCIPEENRGFYEDVMCQGSGVANGQVYHYTKISKDGLAQSTPLPQAEFTRGITSLGKDPTPKRTVAADPSCPGFNYGSKLYIYWGENNPWNGYYVVEDTGSAFKGRCDKMDIYAGVGEIALNDTLKYVGPNAKVCVLDKDFKMPDPDFSGSSTFVDPVSGEYTLSYGHDIIISGITTLFDKTKQLLDTMITKCGKKATEAEKEACITNEMQTATRIQHGLNVSYCDDKVKERIWTTNAVSNDLFLIVTQKNYKVIGTVTQVNANNVDLFAAFIPTQNSQPGSLIMQSPTKPSLLSTFTQTPKSAIITIADESGELKVNISGDAIEWIDYLNNASSLYESDGFLRPGSKVQMNVTRIVNSTYDGYVLTKFNAISSYPKDILDEELIKTAKTIAECATATASCVCTTEPTRMLGAVNMTEDEMSSVANEELIINVPFKMSQSVVVDTSSAQKFTITVSANSGINSVLPSTANDINALPQCVPAKRYKYICSALQDEPELGKIGYTLKI